MRKNSKRLKRNNLLVFITFICSIFFIYNIILLGPIEKTVRYIVIVIIVLIDLILYLNRRKKNLPTLLIFIFICINLIGGFGINKVYSLIDSINKNKIVYSSSLITMQSSNIKNIDDVTKYKIGIIDDSLSVDNYIIANSIIEDKKLDKDNEIISYDDLVVMLNDLYKGKIDLMFISSNYVTMFQDLDNFNNIKDDVKVIYSKDKTIKKESNTFSFNKGNDIKPFSILLMGVDSEKEGLKKNAYANGDGLMILTFNPNTLNITMMSIPRDSYLPIACRNNTENKLTHAGWFGTDCMI